jgi:transcriptional regulator GlxA family with amidase domain
MMCIARTDNIRGETDKMAICDPPAEIAILLYPDVAGATVYGLTDMFRTATTLARQHMGADAPILRVTHWLPSAANDTISCVFDTYPQVASAPVAVIVPGSWDEPNPDVVRCLVQWLVERHTAGTTLCSVCGGAFVLAATGLLAGRTATTHWGFTETLALRFPDIHVDESRLIVEDGNFITAGGVLAWTDLGLKLVDRHLGPSIMLETARFMLVDPPGREQRYYSNFSPRLNHGDAAVLKVQHWLQTQAIRQPSVSQMAAISGLEGRTFLRRFQKATGLKPTQYGQRLRVGKAREMLEFTNQTIDQVAWAVGYQDSSAFRKVFQKNVGLPATAYRRRFAVAGSRNVQNVGEGC